jgi:hypothetical protein
MAACADDIVIGNVDQDNYATHTGGESLAYVADQDGNQQYSTAEFRGSGSTTLFLKTAKSDGADNLIAYTYDKAALDAYNTATGNAYEAMPQALVTLPDGGADLLPAGQKRSAGIAVGYQSGPELDAGKSYVIPLRVSITSGNLKLPEGTGTHLIFVKDLTGTPDCAKASGVKLFSCMEVNGTNPLNNLCFTLKNSGKYMVDYVILFSSNINYDAARGRAYLFHNENVQAILSNREKYLKPLKDRGMKVILSILGNHDRAGVANLSEEMARDFAREVKATCDAYDLDGVFLDDEYSEYITPPPPGFVSPSNAAAARLYYEIHKLQPDRANIAYVYSRTSSLPAVEDLESGYFVDYALHDYGGSYDLSSQYPGMPKERMGLHSQEFARGRWASETNLQNMRANGYLAHMIFAMSPTTGNFQSQQLPAMEKIARALYDDECVYDGQPYQVDWK